jgi:Zn-finger nucleic acid-binding protein
MSLALLRGRGDETLVPRLWTEATAHPRPGIACALCRRSSVAVVIGQVELDLCRPCQSWWFDAAELSQFPHPPMPTKKSSADPRSAHKRTSSETTDEGSVVVDVIDGLFQILTSWH